MMRRFLFSYAPHGCTQSTRFYFVWLSDRQKDCELAARMSEYARVNTHFLFVPYSSVWMQFLDRFFGGNSLSYAYRRGVCSINHLSPVFFRRWCRGVVQIPNIPNVNLDYLPQ